MGLRFDPMGGGQFKAAIKQIMDAERAPVKQLEARKAKEQTKLKLFEQFKTKFSGLDKALDDISTFKKFRELKADLGDGANIASVTLDKEKAEPGNYQIEVDDLAQKTSVITNGFEDPDDTVLGVGFITMKLANGDKAEVYVDDKHASLNGVARLINQQTNFPVRAAVIKDASEDDTPWKLVLTAKEQGKDNDIDVPDFYFLDGEESLEIDDSNPAQNASIKMDGFPIETESNDVTDFLPGVNLHLKQARPDQPFTLTISEDMQKVTGKMKTLVDQLNGILGFISQQNAIDKDSDTSTTFAGDSGLQSIEFQLRNMMHERYGVGDPDTDNFKIYFMSDLGIEFDKTGQLTFKEDKFQKTLEKNFTAMSDVISGPEGFANEMRKLVQGYTRMGDGFLAIRDKSLRARIKNIDDQIDQKQVALEKKEQSLVGQFSRLEGSLADMQKQQQYLTASLGSAGGSGTLAQLLGG